MRRYGTYRGDYDREIYSRRGRDSRGRYSNSGRDMSYRGDEMLDDMHEGYREYSEGKTRYGAGTETLKSLEYMLKSVEDFMEMLADEAGSEEEMEMIRRTARKISEM